MKWKIWYDDETSLGTDATHEGETLAQWEALPRDGVLFVRVSKPNVADIIHMGCDYYWFETCLTRPNCGTIKSCNPQDLHNYLTRARGMKHVKIGRWADDEVYAHAYAEAVG